MVAGQQNTADANNEETTSLDGAEGEEAMEVSDSESDAVSESAALRAEVSSTSHHYRSIGSTTVGYTCATQLGSSAAAHGSPATRQAVKIDLSGINTYGGGPDDSLDDWFQGVALVYDYHVTALGAPESTFVIAIAQRLTGDARVWWTGTRSLSRPTDWLSLQAAMRKVFQPVTNETQARFELTEVKQGQTAISAYNARFRVVRTRAGAIMQGASIEPFIVELYIRGLHSADMREKVAMPPPKSVDEAMERATHISNQRLNGASSSAAVRRQRRLGRCW